MKRQTLSVALLIGLTLLATGVSQGSGKDAPNPYCVAKGKNCDLIDDDCGGKIDCGACTGTDTCGGGGVPNVCGCTPKDCTGGECGEIDRGCGLGKLQCGDCASPNTCGGGGAPNVCGCTPKAPIVCSGRCGLIDRGCDIKQNCGGCPTGSICRFNFCQPVCPCGGLWPNCHEPCPRGKPAGVDMERRRP